jgi:hypothetical protein
MEVSENFDFNQQNAGQVTAVIIQQTVRSWC